MSKYSAEIQEIIGLIPMLNEDNADVLIEAGIMDGNRKATAKGLDFLSKLKTAKESMKILNQFL